VPVRLVRVDGAWRLGPGLVAAIPSLYAEYGPGWIGDRLPLVLIEHQFLEIQAWQWIGLAIALFVALFVAVVLGALARRIALRLTKRTSFDWDDLLVDTAAGPARLLLGTSTFAVAVRTLHLAVPAQEAVDQLLGIGAIVLFSWAGLRALRFGADLFVERAAEPLEITRDPLRGRTARVMLESAGPFAPGPRQQPRGPWPAEAQSAG
jgi:hypothetical protein